MGNFFKQLRQRKVFTVGAAYIVIAWLLLQVAATVLPIFDTPAWVLKAVTVLLALGFPVAVLLAWAYELTPQGVVRTDSGGQAQAVADAGRRHRNARGIAGRSEPGRDLWLELWRLHVAYGPGPGAGYF